MKLQKLVLASTVSLVSAFASAECVVEGGGEVNVLSNFFEALEVLSNGNGELRERWPHR